MAGGPYLRNVACQQPSKTHRGTSEEQDDSPQRRRNISGVNDCVFTLIQLRALDIFLAQSIPPPQLRPEPVHGERTPIAGVEFLIPTLFLQYRPLTQVPCQPTQYRQPIRTGCCKRGIMSEVSYIALECSQATSHVFRSPGYASGILR